MIDNVSFFVASNKYVAVSVAVVFVVSVVAVNVLPLIVTSSAGVTESEYAPSIYTGNSSAP